MRPWTPVWVLEIHGRDTDGEGGSGNDESMSSPACRSLTERVYACLRADILAGRFAPGQRLRPAELAGANGVSLNVVREALNRLAGERLVQASPQQGFAVTEVSAADLADLTDIRVLVETAALRRSIERGDLAWESALVAAHHRLAGTPMTSGDAPGQITGDWMDAHNAFHAATMRGCGSPRLIEIAASLGGSAGMYRHFSQRYDHGRRDIAAEHRAIFEATLARDADLACRLHAEHIQRTAEIVTKALTRTDAPADQPASA
jgi:GntR family transcriptional regulator, carbon starvation induced regulator